EVRSRHHSIQTFSLIKHPLRVADTYISFSPKVFDFHIQADGLPEHYPVVFTGIPSFDPFFAWKDLEPEGTDVLFIDQPLHETGLMGWTAEEKRKFLNGLAACIRAQGKQLYIKPHPWNQQDSYGQVKNLPYVRFVERWEAVVPNVTTVVGFASTLLLPFMAMNHMACLTLELHPRPGAQPYSGFLLESGACRAVRSFEELSERLSVREDWFPAQREAKEHFIRHWMYRFDGRSFQRLRSVLLGEEKPAVTANL
ncbi:MAG TPA: polysialyltransferase family glycosyltransferase, partial [Chitinophagaceae bacterium]|nr:polysialyltransferase family glycosyltransferase [Chitinophagaceae bacterium]